MEFLTSPSQKFDLPKRIERLGELATNLWWSWHPEAAHLFGRLDYDLWERLGHNPIRILNEVGRTRLNQASKEKEYLELYDAVFKTFDAYFSKETWSQKTHKELTKPIAYFSMEYGLHETLPIYSGGLGVLSGDHLKEASDLGLPFLAIGFMYAQGYFSQRITEDGWQEAINNPLNFDHLPVSLVTKNGKPVTVSFDFPDRKLTAQIWEVRVGRVPLYLLDSNVESNSDYDRLLTARLYWSDLDRRIMQEVLLGIGGARLAVNSTGTHCPAAAVRRLKAALPDWSEEPHRVANHAHHLLHPTPERPSPLFRPLALRAHCLRPKHPVRPGRRTGCHPTRRRRRSAAHTRRGTAGGHDPRPRPRSLRNPRRSGARSEKHGRHEGPPGGAQGNATRRTPRRKPIRLGSRLLGLGHRPC